MRETTPTSLGDVRPSWCPPASVPRDPCEIKYPVDIPLIGVEDVGIPVYRIVYDAMQAGTKFLPEYLPQIYADLQPYVNRLQADVLTTVENQAPHLARRLLDEEVMPRAEELLEDVVAEANTLRDELLTTILATAAASILSIGVAAWWINERESQRDKR